MKADVKKFSGAFVGGHDLSFARALSGLVLTDCSPGDGAAASADEESGERSVFKEFEGSAVRDCVAELPTPVSIAECGKLMDF